MSTNGAFLGFGWAAAYAYLDYPWICSGSFASVGVVSIVSAFLPRSLVYPSTRLLLPVTTLLITLAINSMYAGGIRSGMIVWMLLIPFMAVVVEARLAAAVYLVAVCIFLVGISALEALGGLPEPYTPYLLIQLPVSFITAAWFVAIGTLSFEASKDKAIGRVREARDALQLEVERHLRTHARLENAQDEIVAAAHFSGMAEVATGVLHNVGNGLNAVNVSAALVAERLLPKTADRVERLAELLEGGSVEPEVVRAAGNYARRISESARDEQAGMRRELKRMRDGLDHVKAIVQAQQGYARSVGHVSPVHLDDAVAQTLTLVQASIRNHGIDLQVDLEPLPPVVLDRHKLLQVLTNLVGNARDAVRDVPRKGQISITTRRVGDTVKVEVTDNGVGISPEVRSRLFSHGFTTKKTGHGFGLHVSALSAADLGGRLEVESDGPDQGATFRLVLEDPNWEETQARVESV